MLLADTVSVIAVYWYNVLLVGCVWTDSLVVHLHAMFTLSRGDVWTVYGPRLMMPVRCTCMFPSLVGFPSGKNSCFVSSPNRSAFTLGLLRSVESSARATRGGARSLSRVKSEPQCSHTRFASFG